jgi:RNA polymerase sigma-70 factor (ECF subfamily)
MERNQNSNDLDRFLVAEFLRCGEERVFREIYRRHASSLNQVIGRFVGAWNGDAEDVEQTTWIRAIERLDGFRWESSLSTWLTGIAVNCARECLRRQRREVGVEAEDQAVSPAPRRIHGEITQIDLERAIDGLPERCREVLILHDVEGYTHAEIGRLLGIESGTSKSQLSRARRAVRACLRDNNGET